VERASRNTKSYDPPRITKLMSQHIDKLLTVLAEVKATRSGD
jgi:hypothetical protein